MRCHHYFLAIVAFALSVSAAQAMHAVSLNRVQWPLYYHGGSTGEHLEIEIAEKPTGSTQALVRYDGFLANVAFDEGFGKDSVTVQEVVIRYVEHVLKEDYDQVLRLYAPGADSAEAIAETRNFRKEIAGLTEIGFLSEWIYLGTRFVIAEFRFDGGASRFFGFGFRHTPRGFLLSHERSDDEGIVLDALDYVADGLRHGWLDNHTSHPDELSIPLGEGVFGTALKVDGRLHDQQGDWISPNQGAQVDAPWAVVEKALAKTASPEDAAAVRLSCSKNFVRLADGAGQDHDAQAQAKQRHASLGRIKHVLTMAFGDDFMHYFVEESDPARIRSMFVGKEGDSFCLSQGPGDRRLRRLLQSEVVKDGVWALWVAQRGS